MMGAEFFSLGMIILLHAAQQIPGQRTALVNLFCEIAREENQ
jgi:hypothetical protein